MKKSESVKLRGKKGIRRAIKNDYHTLGSYEKAGAVWAISSGMAWKFINEDYYWPTDKKIEKMVLLIASSIGIRIGNPGGKDLWAMSVKELIWRLQNRELLE